MSVQPSIHFRCPTCNAEHHRGFVDGVSVFRCLRCGYSGHGFHSDADIDRDAYADHCAANADLRRLGLPEVPLGVDPLSHGN
jgi:Zn ribbon nucleic-acid-binding protein